MDIGQARGLRGRFGMVAIAIGAVGSIASILALYLYLNTGGESSSENLQLNTGPAAPMPTPPDEIVVAAGEDFQLAGFEVVEEGGAWDWYKGIWYLPADADLATFPFTDPNGDLYNCSEEQITWFEAQGALPFSAFQSRDLFLSNDASAGGAISITNVRFENAVSDSARLVRVNCGFDDGIGDAPIQEIVLYLDGRAGTYTDAFQPMSLDPNGEIFPEGEIATVNVAPGEAAIARLLIGTISDELGEGQVAAGRVVADMVSPEKGVVILIDDFAVYGRPVGPDGVAALTLADQPYDCASWGEPCTLSKAIAVLKDAGAA